MDSAILEMLEQIRKEIHAHPEVSGNEYKTQERIISFLDKNTSLVISKVAQTGVLAILDSGNVGSATMIRGDIDALPIQETNDFEHKSNTEGVSHKCGHDGHTAILLGLAIHLEENPIKSGKVLLLFQPAEEDGMGAQAVLKDPQFNKIQIDYAFALHNLPGVETHKIVVKENEFTANVKSIIIELCGKTAHAAEPEFGYNPASAIAEILQYAEKQTLNQPADPHFFLITPIFVTLGEKAYGISAGYGEVHLTIRSWSTKLMRKKCQMLEKKIKDISLQYKLRPKVSWTQVFYANINSPEAVGYIRKATEKNSLILAEAKQPFKWGEDFGLFTQQIKGAMFGVGAGKNTPALHNPDYDFPDEIIPTCVAMFYSILTEIHNN